MRTNTIGLRGAAAIVGAAVMWTSLLARGTTYCVGPVGAAGADGSREKPFAIRQVAESVKLKPGDEIVLLDGVYDVGGEGGGAISIASVGTEQAPIVYRAEHRHKAVLDGGMRLKGWRREAPGASGVWACRADRAVRNLLVNGEALLDAASRWRRDGKKTLDEGMFVCEKLDGGGLLIRARPWAGREPKEAYAAEGTVLSIGGAFNVVDGLVIRRAGTGVHVGGRLVHTYRQQGGLYGDLSGLAHNTFGSFNVLRNCIVRDMCGSALTSNESRFNLVEDNVIYNAGIGQGSHGIYVSQGAENLTLRRNVWWRVSGGAIHIYSGSGIDSPRSIVVEDNIFGPDKRGRCFPIRNRKSCAVYVWGGKRWAGHNRIVRNIVLGPNDRAISMHRCHFNLIAHNTFLGSDGAPVQIGSGIGNLVVNNILEYSAGGQEAGMQARPAGYVSFLDADRGTRCSLFVHNVLLPRGGGQDVPVYARHGKVAGGDLFVDRKALDLGLRAGCDAVDAGVSVPNVTDEPRGTAPDAGALEAGEPMSGQGSKFPAIPKWLLEEWPLSKRGQ